MKPALSDKTAFGIEFQEIEDEIVCDAFVEHAQNLAYVEGASEVGGIYADIRRTEMEMWRKFISIVF